MSDGIEATATGSLRRVMCGRDPGEKHRASTPLELLFDLTFVVAVSQAASGLHHTLADDHAGSGLAAYAAVFFAIWWAWMNFTWFASAYDTDDVPYRLLTLVQMAGVLVLAAGVTHVFDDADFTLVVAGYVVMRLAMVTQWLRAAREHPAGRDAALRYAAGVTMVQVGWVARLWAPDAMAWPTFVLLAAAELAVPAWAEFRGGPTSWHPPHRRALQPLRPHRSGRGHPRFIGRHPCRCGRGRRFRPGRPDRHRRPAAGLRPMISRLASPHSPSPYPWSLRC